MITVQLPDKNVTIEFPDGTSPEVMRAAIKKNFYGGKGIFEKKNIEVIPPSVPAEIRAIPATAWELAKGVIPGLKFAEKEEREKLKQPAIGDVFSRQQDLSEEELMDVEFGGKALPESKSIAGAVAPEVQKAIELYAMPGTSKVVKDVIKREVPQAIQKISTTPLWGKPKPGPIVSGIAPQEVTKPTSSAEKIKKYVKEEPTTLDKKIVEQEAKLEAITPKEMSAGMVVPKSSLESLEAQVKGGMGRGGQLPKYAEGSAINLERLNTTDEVKNLINTIAKEQEAKIGKRKVGWEETRKQAEALGWDVQAVKKAWDKKKAFTAAEIEATRQINTNAVTSLRETLANLPYERAKITPEMRATVLDAIDAIRVTSQAASETGRALNIHKKVIAKDPNFMRTQQAKKVVDTLFGKGKRRTDDVIEALRGLNLDNPVEVNQKIYDLTKTKWQKLSDAAYELWINGLLSNPMTHIVNTTSNALTLAAQYPERVIASVVEKGRSKLGVLGGKEQELFRSENAINGFSVIKGLHDATKRFFDTMKTGRTEGSKLEFRPSGLPESVRKVLPGRGLQAEDEFFKSFIQSGELNRLAIREAKKLGLRGDALKSKVTELLKTPTEGMLEQAAERAKYLTFQSDLGKVGQWVMRGRDNVPGLKYFIPFVRTPLNIAKYGLERTPLNIPRIAYKAGKGGLKGGQFSEEVAKTLMGSMVATTAYLMAEEGYLTGGGPKNYNERQELMRTGWQPYSIHIGGKYYSLARLEPIASIVGLAADMKELKDAMTEDEKMAVGTAIASSITKNFTSKTFTQGFAQLSDAISDPKQYGEKMIRNLAGTVVPAVSGGVARAIDPEIKNARTILDTVMARIPVVSESVEARLTPWGEPITRGGTPLARFLSPVQVSEEKGHPIDKELVRLKLNVGMPSKKIKGKELTDEQYETLVKLSGSKSLQQLNRLIESEWYKKMSEEQKSKRISNIVNKNRAWARQVVIGGMAQ